MSESALHGFEFFTELGFVNTVSPVEHFLAVRPIFSSQTWRVHIKHGIELGPTLSVRFDQLRSLITFLTNTLEDIPNLPLWSSEVDSQSNGEQTLLSDLGITVCLEPKEGDERFDFVFKDCTGNSPETVVKAPFCFNIRPRHFNLIFFTGIENQQVSMPKFGEGPGKS